MADRTLVLVPGLLCNEEVWTDQIEGLEPDWSCVVADHGDLDSLGAMAEKILDSATERFAIAGHSMGGRVAMEVVRRAPDRLLGVALMDTGVHPVAEGETGEKEAQGRYALLDKARTEGMRAMGWTWLQGMVHPDRLTDQALVDGILDMISTKDPEIFEAQIRALLGRSDATPLLSTIDVPTLVLTGEQDAWSSPEQHRTIASHIPHAQLVIIPDSGHMSTMERPAEVTAALRSWLDSIPA